MAADGSHRRAQLVVQDGAEAYLPLSELVDVEKDGSRLEKRSAKPAKGIGKPAGRLSSRGVVDKAPCCESQSVAFAERWKANYPGSTPSWTASDPARQKHSHWRAQPHLLVPEVRSRQGRGRGDRAVPSCPRGAARGRRGAPEPRAGADRGQGQGSNQANPEGGVRDDLIPGPGRAQDHRRPAGPGGGEFRGKGATRCPSSAPRIPPKIVCRAAAMRNERNCARRSTRASSPAACSWRTPRGRRRSSSCPCRAHSRSSATCLEPRGLHRRGPRAAAPLGRCRRWAWRRCLCCAFCSTGTRGGSDISSSPSTTRRPLDIFSPSVLPVDDDFACLIAHVACNHPLSPSTFYQMIGKMLANYLRASHVNQICILFTTLFH